ncbi:Ribosomal protein L25/L23 [Geobacter metallireducens RCH3]|uniref:Large ribosomal subunit protein uL23 n=1 Tax=Geobacter metallireducens (strain ATCC 53774 / DSM 7210 / GS-15) TaxID=269799 RepID=RL23_GEOMG|nr:MULTISPECIES: 50S ribosomal protein L23 [Geobacter]Q39Y04.1 RecName: Full=Large ribosomal subunit protein uL23; AltName: Full=50S ribosomal protein L23 [Geobacter metallireducens GS-15]ABB30870.1 ribosomal protein L23 [Geobacter metallireducens GS-15]EHP84768.1 Ribosomal protein L25/L23 [Geobacter metallireducens RCH3]MBT1076301.1 50S ribosomal protein L23 [Geobacter grbiciae]
MNIYDILKKPLVTEKTTLEKDAKNVISFEVDRSANKIEIKNAVEKLFKVEVSEVNTVNVAGKLKRVGRHYGKRSNWKKAYVTLKEGNNVDFFEI